MSKTVPKTGGEPRGEGGSLLSYVSGFGLSLGLTLIPYYLVVHHTIAGMALLVTILGFAMLQMVVQITFFLHLGRGPNARWNIIFFISTIGVVFVIVGGSIMIINNLHYNMMPDDQTKKLIGDEGIYQIGGLKTGACEGQHASHEVIIKNGQASPGHTVAQRCDTLTFINQDNELRDIAFGTHPHHEAYAGEAELMVRKGQNQTITLSDSGTYQFHDHLHPETTGDFTVAP